MARILKSGFGGFATSGVYYFLAYQLDKIYNEKVSNLIAYLITVILNFIIQYTIFSKSNSISNSTSNTTIKYVSILFLELITNLIFVSYLLDKKHILIHYIPDKLKPYYATIIRIIVETSIFFCISYPARSIWIFK